MLWSLLLSSSPSRCASSPTSDPPSASCSFAGLIRESPPCIGSDLVEIAVFCTGITALSECFAFCASRSVLRRQYRPLWIARGYSLSRRMRHLEERWAYYFAFGAYLSVNLVCLMSPCLRSSLDLPLYVGKHARQRCGFRVDLPCCKSSCFVFLSHIDPSYTQYIIMAMRARATPIDPYNPTGEEVLRHPSPFIPIHIPVFSPVIWLNDMIVRVISLIGSVGGPPPSNLHPSSYPSSRHRRIPSDSVESVEEGDAVPIQSVSPATSSAKSRPSRIRVSRGTQDKSRKLD